jgi:Calpain family cysteine protease
MPKRVGEGPILPVAVSSVTSQPTKAPAVSEPAAPGGWQAKPVTRRSLEDPALTKKDRNVAQWKPVDGQLFVNGVGADDPIQGAIGDCYLVSGLASLANVQPEVIRDAIKDNGDGTYTVTFKPDSFLGLFGRSNKPIEVTVDGDMPSKDGKTPLYTSGRDSHELWPMLIEKAYAKLDGNYQTVATGGSPATLWQALTGKHGAMTVNALEGTARLFEKMKNALDEKRPVAASTAPAFKDYEGTGLVKGHVYAVLGVEEKDGQKRVLMRNPWGNKEPGNDGKNDGLFTLPLETFKKQFAFTYFGG